LYPSDHLEYRGDVGAAVARAEDTERAKRRLFASVFLLRDIALMTIGLMGVISSGLGSGSISAAALVLLLVLVVGLVVLRSAGAWSAYEPAAEPWFAGPPDELRGLAEDLSQQRHALEDLAVDVRSDDWAHGR
jgi:hypothetical protein